MFYQHFILFYLCLLFPMLHSLVIQISSTERHIYNHKVALFGPYNFNLTAPLQVSIPRYLCSTTPFKNLTGHVVLVSRGNCSTNSEIEVCDGNCTFASKASNAQLLGAAAIIIGNTPDHHDGLFRMPAPKYYPNNITIPSILISSRVHNELRTLMQCNNHDECHWVGSYIPMATMNDEGEIIDPSDDSTSDTLRLAGFLLLVLPIGWCLIAIVCLIYKFCKERRARDQRTNVARDMPMVAYRRMSGEATQQQMNEQGSTPARTTSPRPTSPTQIRIHNESCAICLEDFTPDLQIKLLPCGHGFHQNCIDPWLNERSELCPICKSSILDHQQTSPGFLSSCVDCR